MAWQTILPRAQHFIGSASTVALTASDLSSPPLPSLPPSLFPGRSPLTTCRHRSPQLGDVTDGVRVRHAVDVPTHRAASAALHVVEDDEDGDDDDDQRRQRRRHQHPLAHHVPAAERDVRQDDHRGEQADQRAAGQHEAADERQRAGDGERRADGAQLGELAPRTAHVAPRLGQLDGEDGDQPAHTPAAAHLGQVGAEDGPRL